MFEQASRQKLRFETKKGMLTVEDLWLLPLKATNTSAVDLDEVAKTAHQALKMSEEISFVAPITPRNTLDQLKMDIVKHIIAVKIAEREAAQKSRDVNDKKQLIMSIISQKKNDELASASVEDLQKMLDAM